MDSCTLHVQFTVSTLIHKTVSYSFTSEGKIKEVNNQEVYQVLFLCRGLTLACLDSPTRMTGDPLLTTEDGLTLTTPPLAVVEGGVHLGNFRMEEGSPTESECLVLGVDNCVVLGVVDIGRVSAVGGILLRTIFGSG